MNDDIEPSQSSPETLPLMEDTLPEGLSENDPLLEMASEMYVETALDEPLPDRADDAPGYAADAFATSPWSGDVDAALAALSTLESYTQEPAPATFESVALISHLAQPPLSALERGQAASVVPALLLIGTGAFLAFLLLTGTPLPRTTALLGLGLGIVGISLISAWLSSGRWAKGNLLLGVLAVLAGIVLVIS